jgi:hypothetical protein
VRVRVRNFARRLHRSPRGRREKQSQVDETKALEKALRLINVQDLTSKFSL